jgi:hypothetical protein
MTDVCSAAAWFCAIRAYAPDPLLLLSTALLALVTWRLVVRTNQLAVDSLKATALADQAHQEQLMPICHFVGTIQMVFVGQNSEASEFTFTEVDALRAEGLQHVRTLYALTGKIRNDGPGTALNIQLDFVTGIREKSQIWGVFPIGVLAPNADVPFSTSIAVWPEAPGNSPLLGWMFRISASNIFGQSAITLHAGGFINGTTMNVDSPGLLFEPPTSITRLSSPRTP